MSSSSEHSEHLLCRERAAIVGLTGGIGCGKTTVLSLFQQLGAPVMQADSLAASYYSDSAFLAQLRKVFGDAVFHQDGSVNKRALASIVFADKSKLERLNSMIHPRVRADLRAWTRQQTAPYVIFESAILYEHGFNEECDAVIEVYLDKASRLERLIERDRTTAQEIEARMRNQLPEEYKLSRADYVVLNYEGNPRARQVAYIHNQLLRRFL